MNLLSFFKDNKKFYISILKYSNINEKLENEFEKLYSKCFNQYSDIHTLIDFVEDQGFNVVILNSKKQLIFIVSFVYNLNTNNIEMYNVCKNFDSKISTTFLLSNIFKYLIKQNEIFQFSNKMILSLVINNNYFIPALFCYQNLGFRYNYNKYKQIINISEPHLQMIINLDKSDIINRNKRIKEINIILNNHFYTNDLLTQFYYKLFEKKNIEAFQIDNKNKLKTKYMRKKINRYLNVLKF